MKPRRSLTGLRPYNLAFNMANAGYAAPASYVAAMGAQGPALGIISSAGTSPTNPAAFFGNYVKASALKIIKAPSAAPAALLKSMAFPMEDGPTPRSMYRPWPRWAHRATAPRS